MASSTLGDLSRRWKIAPWKLRRAADVLNPPLPRAGQYRLVPDDRIDEVRDALRRFGYMTPGAAGQGVTQCP